MTARRRLPFCLAGFLVVAIGILAAPASGQSAQIWGSVADNTGQGLPGVNVRVSGSDIGAASDRRGRFRLTVGAGPFELVFSAIGFETSAYDGVATSGDTIRVAITLRETVYLSGEVVVTAARRPQVATRVPASISVVGPEFLETRNVQRLGDALRHVSGVHMQDNQVNLRGTSGFTYNTGSRVSLLLDGVPLLTPDTDGVAHDALPMSMVSRIEVLKGPGSALYGSGALGGVINLISRDFPEHPVTEIRTFGGVYEPFRHELWRSRWPGGDQLRGLGGVAVSHARGFEGGGGIWMSVAARRDAGFRRLSQDRLIQAHSKLGLRLSERTDFTLLAGLLARERDAFLFWNGARDALNPGVFALAASPDPSGANDNFTNQFSLLPSLTSLVGTSGWLTVRARGFGTLIRPIRSDGSIKPLKDGTVGFRYGGEIQYNRTLPRGQHLTAGVSGDANTTRSSFFQTDDGDELGGQPEGAVYVQWEADVNTRLAAVAGARFDVFRISSVETTKRLSPKLGVNLAVSKSASLRAQAGLGFRVPSLAERFTEDNSFLPIKRNPVLRPEKSASIEIGARGIVRRGHTGFEWDIAGFWYRLVDLIEPRFVRETTADGTSLGFQFLNVARGRVAGAEASIEGALFDRRLPVRLGYTLLSTRDRETGDPLPFRPRHLLVASVDFRPPGRLDAGLDFRYSDRPRFVDSDFARFVPDATVLVPVRVVDLRLGYRVGFARAGILVQNALDYVYLERPAMIAAPRTYQLQLNLRF